MRGSGSYRWQLYVARARQKFGTKSQHPTEAGDAADSEGEEANLQDIADEAVITAVEHDNGELNILTARARR